MKRRDFLKRLGIGTAAIVAVPLVLGKEESMSPYDVPMQDSSEYYKDLHTKSGWYDKNPYNTSDWSSLYPSPADPSVWKELHKRYGTIRDMVR